MIGNLTNLTGRLPVGQEAEGGMALLGWEGLLGNEAWMVAYSGALSNCFPEVLSN